MTWVCEDALDSSEHAPACSFYAHACGCGRPCKRASISVREHLRACAYVSGEHACHECLNVHL
eukprot:137892-Pleurochrysis_carterae.AAC.2